VPYPASEQQRGKNVEQAGAQAVPHIHGANAAMQDAEIEHEQTEHDSEEEQPRPAGRAADAIHQKPVDGILHHIFGGIGVKRVYLSCPALWFSPSGVRCQVVGGPTAHRMRSGGPTAQPPRRFTDQARHHRTTPRGRATKLEPDALAPAIALGHFHVWKAKLDLLERIAAAGPTSKRIRPRAPALGKS